MSAAVPMARPDAGATATAPPDRLIRLDDALLRWFDGDAGHPGAAPASDEGRAGFTLSLTTVDEQGWPRTALLGLAEVFAPDDAHLVLALWGGSRSNRSLRARGRAVLSFVFGNRFHQWRLVTCRVGAPLSDDAESGLDYHLMALEGGEAHRVPYATLTSGIRHALVDEAGTLARWREQAQRMRRFAKGG